MMFEKAPNPKHQILNKHQFPKEENSKRFGFTLIELLIVIAVIGILVSIATFAYTTAQKKTRDSRRQSDLKALQSGFEQYYADTTSLYPVACSLDTPYMPNGMPKDPKTGTAYTETTDWYNCSTSSYCVCAALEGITNATNDCTGDQGSLPTGYSGFYCVKNVQ